MAEHVGITDPNIHEPKDISTANDQEVYVADGAGSGTWTSQKYTISGVIADISTPGTVYVPIPYAGNVIKVVGVLEGPITVDDSIVVVKDNSGNTMGGATVLFTSSAAGDVDVVSTTVNQDVGNNDFIIVQTDGGSTDAQRWFFTVVVERA